ncbi:MAG TPA: ABC transporter ATP-binding protein, partial [Gemmatimonadales bacterium]|nr:ABC transporter ATP-binding protein [Gemmatimonadales bacterium]
MSHAHSSRERYQKFLEDYKARRLDDLTEDEGKAKPAGKRRGYVRDYLRWLRPYRYAIAALFGFALIAAGLEMIEPLFMRYIIDRVLLNTGLDSASRLIKLNLAGAAFVGVVILSNLVGALKDYRQRLLNTRVILSLRRSLFGRLLHLPMEKLWEMKTGGILSRLTGDVETTTGFLQMAIVSPAISVLRLVISIGVLLVLNWRLALTAVIVIPGAMLISFVAARRVRPIYRSVRKDVEQIDSRVGEAFSGIRIVRAFRSELVELFDYMVGRHTVVRKEMFAHRRELVLWTSWGLLQAAVNVAIVWFGGYMNITGGASIGDIMAFQWYSFLLLNPVWNIVNTFSELQRSLAAMERVFEILEMENDKPDKPDALDAPSIVHEIRFENVEFEYREG